MCTVISINTIKGGTGKTETALNVAYGLSKKGMRVLLVDLDPQSNTTSIIMGDRNNLLPISGAKEYLKTYESYYSKDPSNLIAGALALRDIVSKGVLARDVHHVLEEKCSIHEAICETRYKNMHLLPASGALSTTDAELKRDVCDNPSLRLRSALDEVKGEYDYIIIDNQPFMNALIYNSIGACYKEGDMIIIPVKINRGGLEGVSATIEVVSRWAQRNRRMTPWQGDVKLLLTMKNRNKVDNEWHQALKYTFGDSMFDTVIRYQAKPIEDASLKKQILLEYDPNRNESVSADYYDLVEEILKIRGEIKE